MSKSLLVTGAAGFIGANFVRQIIDETDSVVVNLDKLTYAGSLDNLPGLLDDHPQHIFVHGDICDAELVKRLLAEHQPKAIVNFAAESHVDRSIESPESFVRTNINGVHVLLECALKYRSTLGGGEKGAFRFLHVSTDEVFGSLGPDDAGFNEETSYKPNSPYSASKAAADHLVRAYFHTFDLPTLTTNCSNNYGPLQHPEKLIPLMIYNALEGRPLPVYGNGQNVRDWLYVEDHCRGIRTVLDGGTPGETYNIGGNCERTNIDVVNAVCAILDELQPEAAPHNKLITYVKDRPGHDMRYAVDTAKIKRTLGWEPRESFETGLRKTIEWYMQNKPSDDSEKAQVHRKRLGLTKAGGAESGA